MKTPTIGGPVFLFTLSGEAACPPPVSYATAQILQEI